MDDCGIPTTTYCWTNVSKSATQKEAIRLYLNASGLTAKEKPKQYQLFGLFNFIKKTIKSRLDFDLRIDNTFQLSYVKNSD
jgi:hypothetical protein